MTSEVRVNTSIAAVAALSVFILLAGVGVAYSYNSTINATAELGVQYLSVDIYESDNNPPTWEKETSELSITIPDPSSVIGPDGVIGDQADAALGKKYCIRVSSNAMTGAYVYGYFTSSNPLGAAVEYLQVNFSDGSSTKLYRNVYTNTMIFTGAGIIETLTDLEQDAEKGYNHADFIIKSVVVHYYPGITVSNDKVLFGSVDGSGSVTGGNEEDAETVISISDFVFHFIASSTALLS